jgi:hypothetical protein
LLRKRDRDPIDVPPETDYTGLLERQEIGLVHERLPRDEPLSIEEIIVYLTFSRVTEQRAQRRYGRCGASSTVTRGLGLRSE